jgi:hypothetical protein
MDTPYIKTDNGKFINENTIIWAKKMGDCLKVGTLQTNPFDPFTNIYYICKSNNPNSYNKLNDKLKD